MSESRDWRTLRARAKQYIESGKSKRATAAQLGVPESTLRGQLGDWKPAGALLNNESGVEFGVDGNAVATSSASVDVPDAETVLREHKLDPEDWEIVSARVSRWGKPEEPMYQLRLNIIRKDSLLVVPDLGSFKPRTLGAIEEFSHGSVAFLADPHLPYINAPCFSAVLNFLREEEPNLVVHLGDAGDHGRLSKHRTHKRFAAMLNETNDAVARYFYDCVDAAPDAQHVFIPGNHDARILYYLEDRAEELGNARPGRFPGEDKDPEDAVSLRRFYRLDELGIHFVDEDWKLAAFPIVAELTARHGYLTGNNSERKLLETHGRSQVHGHLHRGEIVYRTKHDPTDVRVSMSVPTLAQVKNDGLGYQPAPNWTPGIGVAHIWDDEMFVVSIAPFIENYLLLPDGRRFHAEGN